MKKIALLMLVFTSSIFIKAVGQTHPAYLHALSDLRAARWMIDHRPGNWKQTEDEMGAVKRIDAAISEIKKAAIDDRKDINEHPKAEEINEHKGRLTKAVEYLRKARADIEKDEDNGFAKGLRKRSFDNIDEAIRLTEKAKQQ
jgi:hypothetical protein